MQAVLNTASAATRPSPPPLPASSAAASRSGLEAAWADSLEDLREVQRLRYRVFVGEGGARLSPPPGTPPGHDADRFDAYCAHLMVRAIVPGEESGEVVGTYRVLTPAAARRAGGFYSETQFDLALPLRAGPARALP